MWILLHFFCHDDVEFWPNFNGIITEQLPIYYESSMNEDSLTIFPWILITKWQRNTSKLNTSPTNAATR